MLKLTRRFPRKRAFITGAASGLGEALALRLAEDGWHLVVVDIHRERLEAVEEEVARRGGQATPVVLDVTDADAYRAVVEGVLDDLDGMDVVFNNAGVAASGLVGEFDLNDWHWLLDVNLRGVIHGCHLFAPVLRAQKSGVIVNTASAAALFPAPMMGAYCVSKSAVLTLSEVMHNELIDHGVDVCCVMPEFFQTNLTETMRGAARAAEKAMKRSGKSAADVAEHVLKQAGRGQLHVVYPRAIRPLWWVRRTAPMAFFPAFRRFVGLAIGKLDPEGRPD